jgi:cytidylate kinase
MVKITIFGLAGTGTSTVGRKLSLILSLKFESSGNIFREMAKSNDMSLAEFGKLCETDSQYDILLDKKIEEFGKKNNDILVESRLAYHFIPDSIKIKLKCKNEIRIKRISDRDNLSLKDAKIATEKREENEKKRYLKYYNINDMGDDKYFDIIVDSSYISIEEVCDYIIKKLREKKIN